MVWGTVPDFPAYLVDDSGNVRSLKFGKEKLLSLVKGNHGYLQVALCRNGVPATRLVHQLVMLTFVGPCPKEMEVRHLNGISTDNRLENLAYGTSKENNVDIVRHGRHNNAIKTHCKWGHAFDLDNTYICKTKSGIGRRCTTCHREKTRIYRSKNMRVHFKESRSGDAK